MRWLVHIDTGAGTDMARGTCRARRRRVADKDRKRVARACDLCRQQKEKCAGGIPCMRCVRLHRECRLSMLHESDHPPELIPAVANGSQSPQLQGQSQPATVEMSDDQDLPELSQRLFYLEKIVRHKFGAQNLDLQALQALSMEAERQDESVRSAENVASRHQTAAVDQKCSIQSVEHTVTHFSGEFSHWNFSMQIKRWVERNIPQNARIPVEGLTEFWRSKDLQCLSSTLAAVSSLPPRFIADFLIHCFFKHAMTNYFYVDRDWLLTKVDKAYTSSASLGRNDAGTICIIFGILAIGTHYAHLEAKPGDTAEFMTNNRLNLSPSTGESAGLAFYHQACRLLPDVITIASLESVQACLVLGVFALPLDASGLAWTYLGLAVKLAVLNGMHKECSEGSFDRQTQEFRNRLWWTVCSLERRIGIFHGRPSPMCRSEIDAGLPVDQYNGVAGTPSPLQCVKATFHLNGILRQLAREMSSLKSVSSTEALHWGLDRLSRSQDELVAWWNRLPSSLSRPEHSSSFSDIRPSAHLKLEYCLVRMFVGRFFLFPEECLRSEGTGSTDCRQPGGSASPRGLDGLKSHLIADCVDAALGAIETCRFLRSTIGLARASYTEFSSCRAALLVITIQCFQTKRGTYRHCLREGLTMLKEMAAWAELARIEAALIDAFEQVLINIDAIQSENPGQESGFMKFKRWESTWKENSSGPSLFRQDDMAQMTEPMWQDWPNISESTSLNLGSNLASFPMPELRGERSPVHLPQTCEDLSTLLDFNFQSS